MKRHSFRNCWPGWVVTRPTSFGWPRPTERPYGSVPADSSGAGRGSSCCVAGGRCRAGRRTADRGLRDRPRPRRAVDPAPIAVRVLAGLAVGASQAVPGPTQLRPGPGRAGVAGLEDRVRAARRGAGRRDRGLGSGDDSTPLLKPDQIGAASMVDVRQTSEFHTGHVPGASHIELGDLAAAALAGPVVTMCGHGERAMTAASILERGGHPVVGVLDGGPEDWAEATGRALA